MNQSAESNTSPAPTGLALIKVSGADSRVFLQGQLTQDTARSAPDTPLLAGWTNAKGRLNFVAWMLNWQDAFWLVLPADVAEWAAKRLRMYVLRAEVAIEIVPAQVSFGALNSSTDINHTATEHCFYDNSSYVFKPITGDERWLTVDLSHADVDAGTAADIWRLANIEAGMPSVRVATLERFVPQMLNLDLLGAISFTKGCYIGQEIVARTQNLGRIKRRMYRFKAAQTTAPGEPIYAGGRPAGEVVDTVATDGGCALLAVARIETLNEPLSIDPAGTVLLQRHPLPYAVPETLDDP